MVSKSKKTISDLSWLDTIFVCFLGKNSENEMFVGEAGAVAVADGVK